MADPSSGSRRKPNYYLQDTTTQHLGAPNQHPSPPSPVNATPSPPGSDQTTPFQSPEAAVHSLAPRPTSKAYQPNSSEVRHSITYGKTRDKGKRRLQQPQKEEEQPIQVEDPYYRNFRSDSFSNSHLRNVSSPPALQVTPPSRQVRDQTADHRLASANYPPSSYTYGRTSVSPRASLGGEGGEEGDEDRTIFTRADDRSPLEKLQLELKHIGKEEGLTGKEGEGISRSLSRKQAERLSRSTSSAARVTSRRLSESDGIATPKGRRAVSAEPADGQSEQDQYQYQQEEDLDYDVYSQPKTKAAATFADRAKKGPSKRWRAPYDPNDPNDVEISPVSSFEDLSDTPVASSQTPVNTGSRQNMRTPTKAAYEPAQLAHQPEPRPAPVLEKPAAVLESQLPSTPPHPPNAALSERAPPPQNALTPGGAMSDTVTPDVTPSAARKPDWQDRLHLRGHFHRHHEQPEVEPHAEDNMHAYDGQYDGQIDNLAHLRASDINIPENIDAQGSDGMHNNFFFSELGIPKGLVLFPTSPETPLHAMVVNPLIDRPQRWPHARFPPVDDPTTTRRLSVAPTSSLPVRKNSISHMGPSYRPSFRSTSSLLHPYFGELERLSVCFPTLTRTLAVRSAPTPSAFNPPLNVRCGPLLRYLGLRKQQSTATHLGDSQSYTEIWRGTIMILTTDVGSTYSPAPRLRLFAQSSLLGTKNNLDPPPRPVTSPASLSHSANGSTSASPKVAEQQRPPSNHQLNGNGQAAFGEAALGQAALGPRRGKDGERANKYREVEATRLLSERGMTFWRFHLEVELTDEQQRIAYKINNGPSIGFWVPAKDQTMNIMFYSCNGFSLSVNPDDFCGPDPLWRDVLRNHQTKPYHVMLGGGDQVYMDCVMNQTKHFGDWLEMRNPLHKYSAPFTNEMREELEDFYRNRYALWFSQGLFGVAGSQIPTINIYDDHDIIDGFGSYAHHFNNCPVFSGLGRVAFKYYLLFQHHTMVDEGEHSEPSWILGANPGPYMNEYSRSTFMFLGRKVAFLGLDCRTERTRDLVVTQETYDRIFERMNREIITGETKHLIVLLGVPIAYPRMVWLENILTSSLMTPIKKLGSLNHGTLNGFLNRFDGTVELLDDMMDHWTARGHKAERNEMILALQKLAVAKNVRVTFLGGDVHLASFGEFYSKRRLKIPKKNDHRYMLNVVSSAIVNTPPPNGLADFLNKRATKRHKLGNSTEETQIKVFFTDPSGKKRNNNTMLPVRNYCTISENTSGDSLSTHRPDVTEPVETENESLIDRAEGLDIVVSCEVDQHDPSGKTKGYGMTVPALSVDGHRSTSEFGGGITDSSVTDASSLRMADRAEA